MGIQSAQERFLFLSGASEKGFLLVAELRRPCLAVAEGRFCRIENG